jgi:hypothetical protein
MGGSGKAEGFADGGWANPRQAALAAATRRAEISRTWDVANEFDGGTRSEQQHRCTEMQTWKLDRLRADFV